MCIYFVARLQYTYHFFDINTEIFLIKTFAFFALAQVRLRGWLLDHRQGSLKHEYLSCGLSYLDILYLNKMLRKYPIRLCMFWKDIVKVQVQK